LNCRQQSLAAELSVEALLASLLARVKKLAEWLGHQLDRRARILCNQPDGLSHQPRPWRCFLPHDLPMTKPGRGAKTAGTLTLYSSAKKQHNQIR